MIQHLRGWGFLSIFSQLPDMTMMMMSRTNKSKGSVYSIIYFDSQDETSSEEHFHFSFISNKWRLFSSSSAVACARPPIYHRIDSLSIVLYTFDLLLTAEVNHHVSHSIFVWFASISWSKMRCRRQLVLDSVAYIVHITSFDSLKLLFTNRAVECFTALRSFLI